VLLAPVLSLTDPPSAADARRDLLTGDPLPLSVLDAAGTILADLSA
jgi:hypothetical protein